MGRYYSRSDVIFVMLLYVGWFYLCSGLMSGPLLYMKSYFRPTLNFGEGPISRDGGWGRGWGLVLIVIPVALIGHIWGGSLLSVFLLQS